MHAPASASANSASAGWPTLYICAAKKSAAIAPTPAASPSRPSSQFTVFIIPAIHTHVSATTSSGPSGCQPPSTTSSPLSGFVKRSMNTVLNIAITAAANCPSSCGIGPSSRQSSNNPRPKTNSVPSSMPAMRRRSGPPVGASSHHATAHPANSASTSPTPPSREIVPACWRRPSGASTRRHRRPSQPASGVQSRLAASAVAKTIRAVGMSK